jgi:hypothetical protein
MANRIFELLCPNQSYTNNLLQTDEASKVRILAEELKLVQTSLSNDAVRCSDFYQHITKMIALIDVRVIQQLSEYTAPLIELLTNFIIEREIRENNTQKADYVLQGSLNLLASLI